jgi:hypothetical protein
MFGSELIKKWNRANPFSVIDEKTQFKEGFLKQYLQDNSQDLEEIRKDLLGPFNDRIMNDKKLLAEEKNQQILLAEKMMTFAHPLVWFVMIRFRSDRDCRLLIGDMRLCLMEYMKKTIIAEYAAMMIIELACNIENLNLLHEAELQYKTKNIDLHRVLQDPGIRIPLLEVLKNKNSLITISWKLGGADSSIGKRGKFQVILYDRELHYQERKDNFDATKSADISRFNLSDFYKRLLKDGSDLDLGMYYLSFLSEACENAGIKFEAMVNEVRHAGLTITTLFFSL